MFRYSDLKPYQLKTIDYILNEKRCGLNLEMGLGKTICSLTAFVKLQNIEVKKLLIIAPLNVAKNVWHKELSKWEHTKHLTYSIACGNSKERTEALNKDVDIYIINQENIPWMYLNGFFKYGMIIVDESTGFKNYSSKRFKALSKFINKYIVLLTGTPIANGYQDIWSQQYLIDGGKLLGKNITTYRNLYFNKSYNGFTYTCHSPDKISKLLTKNWLRMSVEDYLTLPDKIILNSYVDIKNLKKYKKFEKEFYLNTNEEEIVAANSGVLTNKLLQYTNGAVYKEDGTYIELHTEKLECLKQIIENYPNENILVSFTFKSDEERIKKILPYAITLNSKNVDDIEAKWNNNEIKLLLCHSSSAKGLNLQKGGRIIIWFSLTWNLEDYLQFNSRLYRQGQIKPVVIHHILANNTKDIKLQKVLNMKNITQERLFEYLAK